MQEYAAAVVLLCSVNMNFSFIQFKLFKQTI